MERCRLSFGRSERIRQPFANFDPALTREGTQIRGRSVSFFEGTTSGRFDFAAYSRGVSSSDPEARRHFRKIDSVRGKDSRRTIAMRGGLDGPQRSARRYSSCSFSRHARPRDTPASCQTAFPRRRPTTRPRRKCTHRRTTPISRRGKPARVRPVPPADLRRVERLDDVQFLARSRVARGFLPAGASHRDGRQLRRAGAAGRDGEVARKPVRECELHVHVRPRYRVVHHQGLRLAARRLLLAVSHAGELHRRGPARKRDEGRRHRGSNTASWIRISISRRRGALRSRSRRSPKHSRNTLAGQLGLTCSFCHTIAEPGTRRFTTYRLRETPTCRRSAKGRAPNRCLRRWPK